MKSILSVLALTLFASNFFAMDESSSQQVGKILSYNICTTYNLYGTSLDPAKRLPRIVKQIKDFAPDIICLQEARKSEAKYLSASLHKLGHSVILSPVNAGKNSATLITAYDDSKYFCQDNKKWWYTSGDPTKFGANKWYKWGRILTLATLYKVKGDMPDYNSKPLHIANTHLGLNEDEKEMSIDLGLSLLDKYKNDPIIWCGDFNYFRDKRAEKQRKMIAKKGYTDNLEFLTDFSGKPLSGTFVGYSGDNFIPVSLDKLTKLDGMHSRNVKVSSAKCPLFNLKSDLSNRDELASDHLPIVAKMEIESEK